jgi:hypothetical protein
LLPPGDGSPCARTTAGTGGIEQHGRPGGHDHAEWKRGINHSAADRRSCSDPDGGSWIDIEPAHAELAAGHHSDASPVVAGGAAPHTDSGPAADTNPDANRGLDANPDASRHANPDANPEPNADAVPDATPDPGANSDPGANPGPYPASNPNANSNSGANTSPNSMGVRPAGPDPAPDQPCGDGAPGCDAAGRWAGPGRGGQ